MIYLRQIFKSKVCVLTFIIALIISYLLIPKKAFYGVYTIISVLFMISLALTITCIVRNTKEKVLLARTYESSIIGIIATAIGLASLQVCGVGAPVCGAAVGVGILASVMPYTLMSTITNHAGTLLIISIIFQITALYFMNCFKSIEEHNRNMLKTGKAKIKINPKYLNNK